MNIRVPWNAAWTGEDKAFELRPCRFVQGKLALWQPHRPGTGKPMFAEPHIVRQRRSIAEMRCTVCGERTPAGDRWWFEHGTHHDGWFMTLEAPVHRACADHSLAVCPHLRQRGVEPGRFPAGARIAPPIRATFALATYSIGWSSGDQPGTDRVLRRTLPQRFPAQHDSAAISPRRRAQLPPSRR